MQETEGDACVESSDDELTAEPDSDEIEMTDTGAEAVIHSESEAQSKASLRDPDSNYPCDTSNF